jgi:HAE1 family hydrophobic/amphiphilic exporter-1
MTIGANGEMDEVAFYDLMDKKIALYFPVSCWQINIIGGQEREIQVNLDVLNASYGLSVPQLQVIYLKFRLPTGNIRTRDQKILIRLAGKYKMLTNYET